MKRSMRASVARCRTHCLLNLSHCTYLNFPFGLGAEVIMANPVPPDLISVERGSSSLFVRGVFLARNFFHCGWNQRIGFALKRVRWWSAR